MTDDPSRLASGLSVDLLTAVARRRERQIVFWAAILSLGLGLVYTVKDSPLLPVVFLIVLAVPVILWRWPNAIVWLTFTSACLFELFPTPYRDASTDLVPIFWNLNTVFQRYAHADFKAVPLNLLEILLLITAVCAFLRGALLRDSVREARLRSGPLLGPILGYLAFVAWAFANGLAHGGDMKIALQESRAQFYFLLAYLMTVNMIGGGVDGAPRWDLVRKLWWCMALSIGLKGLLYTVRRYVTLAGTPLPDQGVGSHEEAFFFTVFVLLLLCLLLVNAPDHRRLRTVMLCLLPIVILGNLATNRRAGTAALAITTPLLLMGAYRALPGRRRQIAVSVLVAVPLLVGYYQVFKNSDSAIAQPARAIKSQFNPDKRDASSNAYRDAENLNQLATIRSSPILGYGYGRRMLHVVPMADIGEVYEWWDILPHNQILWVWMRVGTIGYVAFWIMVCAVILLCCRNLRDGGAGVDCQVMALFGLSSFVALLVFGLLDLQLSNFRDMLFSGFVVGCLPWPLQPKDDPKGLVGVRGDAQ